MPTAALFSNHDDLCLLLDFLGIERAHVCGLSMGGGVTIDFALEHPNRVLSVIVIGSAVGGFDVDFGSMIPAMIAMQTAGRDGNLAEAKRIWVESPSSCLRTGILPSPNGWARSSTTGRAGT